MAFITVTGNVISYAESEDVKDKDQRVFESNEIDFASAPNAPGTLDQYVEDLTEKATARINQKIRASSQWLDYQSQLGGDVNSASSIPVVDMNRIRDRQSDFTDLCSYYTLKEYLLPKVADWGDPESAEVQKIAHFGKKFDDLFNELMSLMDWYDFDDDGTIQDNERIIFKSKRRRSRGRASVVRIR